MQNDSSIDIINATEANYELQGSDQNATQDRQPHSLFITDHDAKSDLTQNTTTKSDNTDTSLININETTYEQAKILPTAPKIESISTEQPPPQTTITEPEKRVPHHNIIQLLIDINYLIFFSYTGFATRYGLEAAFASPQGIGYTCLYFILFIDFYANTLGCFIMGLFAEINATLLKPNNSTRLSNLVAVGVMTGYCGCTTTFSSWQYDSMYALLTAQVGTFFLREIIGFCVSYYALLLGHGMTTLIIVPTYNAIVVRWKKKDKTLIQEFRHMSTALTWVWRVTTALFIVANVILTALFIALLSSPLSQTTRIVSAAMLFSPLGCILRFLFTLLNAKFGPKIPIFTLCANLLATVVVGFFRVTNQRYTSISGNEALNVFFMGVSGGFCGCLSTVSSLVEELHTKLIDVRWRYLYLLLTFVLPCLALVAIVGPFIWTK